MAYFPFFTDIEGQDCLIVGGGAVARRKVEVLLGYGPHITVVAPEISPEIRRLKEELADGEKSAVQMVEGSLNLLTRPFQMEDLAGRDFVVAATEDDGLNHKISQACRDHKIPVNVVDVKEECSFIFPSIVREGNLVVGISSGGGSPTITQELKRQVRELIPEGYGRLVDDLGSWRDYVKEQVPEIEDRIAIFRKLTEAGKENGCRLNRDLVDQVIGQVLGEREGQWSRTTVRIGTRKSALAIAQTELVADLMKARFPGLKVELVMKQTVGDKILDKPLLEFGGKGVFVSEFEEALQKGDIDFAVHSAKDLPMKLAEGLEIVGVPEREDVRDVIVTRKDSALEEKIRKQEGIIVGTSSLRRQMQIEYLAGDLWNGASVECRNLRGNVLTRLEKLASGEYDAIILAAAGLNRLGDLPELGQFNLSYLDWTDMIPAGCQGILAVEGRKGNPVNNIAREISEESALLSFRLERRVLALLEAGCHEPIGVCSRSDGENLEAWAFYGGSQESGEQPRRSHWKGSGEEWEAGAEKLAADLKNQSPYSGRVGSVTLAGAGPGDPGLITVKSLAALRTCDTVVYDSLASEELLRETKPDCRKINVGKRAGHHSKKQEEINAILINEARMGRQVVRLKGGDPFVFGRGGEEILALQEAEIPYQVIPGVTSPVAALASAGIPITHRGISRSFHVVTGHTRDNGIPEDVEKLANVPGTLVFLMGLNHLGEICDCLIQNGKSRHTPAAVIQNGTLPEQRTVRGTLEDIQEKCEEAKIGSPAIIVVGEAAALHMEGTMKRPLDGVRIGMVGTPSFTRRLSAALQEKGGKAEPVYTMDVQAFPGSPAVRQCMEELDTYTWAAFTSANGVRLFFDMVMESGKDMRAFGRMKVAAVGPGTAKELEKRGIRADYIPLEYCTESLAEGLVKILKEHDRLLIPRALKGSLELARILEEAGISYSDIPVYDVCGKDTEREPLRERLSGLDYLIFASASGVNSFLDALEKAEPGREILDSIRLACIGDATAKALADRGKRASVTARKFSIDGLTEEICRDCKPLFI